jgi:hypothetical protein
MSDSAPWNNILFTVGAFSSVAYRGTTLQVGTWQVQLPIRSLDFQLS